MTGTNDEVLAAVHNECAHGDGAPGHAVDQSNEFVTLLHGAMRSVRRESGAHLHPLGTTPGQFRMLRFLANRAEPQRLGVVAEFLDIVPRSVTSKVDDAEDAGLVHRLPDPSDRRATLVELTEQGRCVVEQVIADRAASALGLLSRLSTAEQAELLRMLRIIAGPAVN